MNSERWGATRGLIDRFWPPLRERDRVEEERIAVAEARLGVTLPAALREWYCLAGNRRDFLGNMDCLYAPESIEWSADAPDVLVFMSETCNCCEWGIRREDMGQEDPPVVEVNPDRMEEEDEDCVYPHSDSVSDFLAWMIHEGLFLSAPFNNGVARYGGPVSTNVPDGVKGALREHYPPLSGPAGLSGAELLGDSDTLLRFSVENGRAVVDVAVRTVAAAERLVSLTGFPSDELQHQSRYWGHRFGPACKDIAPGYILRQPFPDGMEVDDDALMETPYCQADTAGGSHSTRKL
jgi:hypothetical protein